MTAYIASWELFKFNFLCAGPQEMKNDIKSNPASKYSKNFRSEWQVFEVWKTILRKAYCTPSTCNKCRSYLLRHTQGESMAENTYPLHSRGNFRFFKTTNDASALVSLLHFRLGFNLKLSNDCFKYESLIWSANHWVEY